MCGIAGVLYSDPQRTPDRQVLRSMGDSIAHRGPDGSGYFVANNVGLIHRRLAIIDLAGGDQPIANEDESVQVVFNGELYNYRELRTQLEASGHRFRTSSDTEVLVHLYEEYGRDLVTRLRGMFAFALWDAKERRLLLARDHVGQKPLYVYRDHEKLVFGSELKAILAHPEIDRSLSPEAIEDYLTFGVIPGERAIFRNVIRLPAAHTMLVDGRAGSTINLRPQRYWQLSFDHEATGSESDWLQRVGDKVRESVEAHLVADVPVGAFLSGGLDSSAIVASVADLVKEPVRTFSIGFQEKRFSELPYAAEVARHFGTNHHEAIVTPDAVRDFDELVHFYDEPFADASAIPSLAVARMASEHVKVCLSGDGGDEAFGGYSRYAHDLKEARLRAFLPGWFRTRLLNKLAVMWPKADWLPRPLRLKTLLQNLSASPATAYANTVSACRQSLRHQLLNATFRKQLGTHRPEAFVESAFEAGHRDPLSGMLSADTNFLLPDDFLTKVDRASMASGLEVRPPLLDYQLLELAATMPSEFKVRRGCKKWILKQLFESRLPAQLAHRRKQGFELPIDAWLRGPLRPQVEQHVVNADAAVAQFIDVDVARWLFTAHQSGTGRHGQVLWSLLVLGRWLDRYTTDDSATISQRRPSTNHSLLAAQV
ncbi:MAG: amidotransferase 1, exosortase A system-associated [Fuerstiella sp.]